MDGFRFCFFIPSDSLLIDSIYFCLTESELISAFLLCFVFFIFLLSFNLQKFNNM